MGQYHYILTFQWSPRKRVTRAHTIAGIGEAPPGGISRSRIYDMTLSEARRHAGTDDVVTLFFAAEPDEKIGAPRPRTP